MQGRETMAVNPRVLVWGSAGPAAEFVDMIKGRQPVIWAASHAPELPPAHAVETLWGYEIRELQGSAGCFRAGLEKDGRRQWVEAGAVVLFPGEDPWLGIPDPPRGQSILLALARAERGTFSRALDFALKLVRDNWVYLVTDAVQVAYPGGEAKFSRARQQGVIFFRADDYKISPRSPGGYLLWLPEVGLGHGLSGAELEVDLVMELTGDNSRESELRRRLGLGREPGSGLLTTWREGVFLFPSPHEVAREEESCLLAALAARVGYYASGRVEIEETLQVNPELCALCLTCLRLCPHRAIEVVRDPGYPNLYRAACRINPVACRACGSCYAECPARAISWSRETESKAERPLFLVCENSGSHWLERLGEKVDYRSYPCASAIPGEEILELLDGGEREVIILACREGSCRHRGRENRAERRGERINRMREELGLPDKVRVIRVSAADSKALDADLGG